MRVRPSLPSGDIITLLNVHALNPATNCKVFWEEPMGGHPAAVELSGSGGHELAHLRVGCRLYTRVVGE